MHCRIYFSHRAHGEHREEIFDYFLNFVISVISVRYNLSLSGKKPSESIRVPVAKPQYISRQAGLNLHHFPTVNREPVFNFNLHPSPTVNREPLNRELGLSQYLLYPFDRLFCSVWVFHQCKPDKIVTIFSETNTGRNSNFCFFNEHHGKFY